MIRAALIAIAMSMTVSATVAQPLTIGVGAPLSGPDAIFGDQILLGVREAIADAPGSFMGETPKLVRGDDSSDIKKGVEVAKSFAHDKISFVIGHFSSAVTVAASAIYAEAGMLDITPSALAPMVTDRGLTMVFRTCGREDQQAAVAARYLAGHYSRIAIVHDRTANGKSLADSVRKALADNDIKDVFYGSLEKGTRDYPGLVARLKASGTQVVFWGGTQTEAGLLVHQLREAGAKVPLMGGLGIASDEFASLAGAGADGTMMVFPRDPRRRPEAARLLRRLQAKGIEPDGTVFYAYAAVQVLQQAATKATSLDPATVAETMHSGTTFQTVLGPMAFDAKGDPTTSDLTIYVWHRGPSGRMAYDTEADG